jgi:hypothetical protein
VPSSGLINGVPLCALDKHTRPGRQSIGRFAQENAEIARFLSERGCSSGDDRALRMAVFYADGAVTRPTCGGDIRQSSQPPASPPISTASMSPQRSAPNWQNSSLLTSPISIQSVLSCSPAPCRPTADQTGHLSSLGDGAKNSREN